MTAGQAETGPRLSSTAVSVAPEANFDEDAVLRSFRRRLQWLMGVRLVAASILLALTLLLTEGFSYDRFTPKLLLGLAISTYGATVFFALALPRIRRHTMAFAQAQLAWDLIFATTLVYVTGGVASGFTFLYGVAVLAAALIVGPRTAQGTAVAGLLAFVVVGISLASGWLPAPPDQPSERYLLSGGQLGFPLLSNVVGLVLVTLLASSLADRLRRTGGELQRAAAHVESLARLNDDIVRSLASGLLTTDLNGTVQTINPAGAEIFRGTAASLIGRPFHTLVRPREGEEPGRGVGVGIRSEGEEFPIGFTQGPLIGSAGTVIGELVTFQDLTEIERLRRAAEQSERLATLGRLSAGLAHEIRNPLSSISGSVELVRESENLDPEEGRLLGIVLSEVERLNDLVTTMLQVGRPRQPSRSPTDLVALLREVVAVTQAGSQNVGHVRVERAGDEGPVHALVDPDQIRQVVWNLIKNASQASPRRGTVTVSVERLENGASISVADEGPGIDAEQMGRLFETFYSGRPHGVGLGLALVRQIVDAHDGSIAVESAPGEGATFRVLLPTLPAS